MKRYNDASDVRAFVALSLAIIVAACATSPVAKSPEQRVLEAVKLADGIYLDTMAAAGEAHRAKVLNDADFATILALGEDVRAARQTALASLVAYLSVTSGQPDPADLDAALSAFDDARHRLERAGLNPAISALIAKYRKHREHGHATD